MEFPLWVRERVRAEVTILSGDMLRPHTDSRPENEAWELKCQLPFVRDIDRTNDTSNRHGCYADPTDIALLDICCGTSAIEWGC
jgi:hypothetical protein